MADTTTLKVRPQVMTDKKALLNWRTNHDLHVLLLMKQHGLTKGQATVQAYCEGVEGLNARMDA